MINRMRNYKRQVDTLNEMKSTMRKRIMSATTIKSCIRLQSLSQGTKSLDEYFKKIKLVMIWANVDKDR